MDVSTTVPSEPTVTMTMSVKEFRLLDAIQYYFLGGGLNECLEINDKFRAARNELGVEKMPKRVTDQGFGLYFDAHKAQVAEELGDS